MGGRAGMVVAALLVVLLAGCEATGTGEQRPPPATEAAPAPEPSAEPPAPTREELVAGLATEARALEKGVKLARPGRDRLVAAQDAAAAWARWAEVSGKPLPASAVRVSKIAAREEAAAARREARESRSFAPARECCRHCTKGCPCGDSCIACSKACLKGPGCAC